MSKPLMVIQVNSYDPQNVKQAERAKQEIEALGKFDVVVLPTSGDTRALIHVYEGSSAV